MKNLSQYFKVGKSYFVFILTPNFNKWILVPVCTIVFGRDRFFGHLSFSIEFYFLCIGTGFKLVIEKQEEE